MKFVALVSGGKDSFYSIMECIRNGHELLACAHLSPRVQKDTEEEESYMYQTAASEAIPTLIEECLGVPLVIRQCVGRSQNTSLVYDHHNSIEMDDDETVGIIQDEVEDLYELILQIKRQFPSVQAISSGAILSTYQRTRIESVCFRLDLTPLGYMWRSGVQRNLLECMIKDGISAVLVKVASPPGLMPQKHLNKSLGQLFYGGIFDRLKERFDFHICGEGGEYETLVLDCPLFRKKKLSLDEVEIVETDDGVGILRVLKCSAVEKEESPEWTVDGKLLHQRICDGEEEGEIEAIEDINAHNDAPHQVTMTTYRSKLRFYSLPHVKILSGGLAHVSEILSQAVLNENDLGGIINAKNRADIEGDLAVMEAKCIFDTLKITLSKILWNPSDDDAQRNNENAATPRDVVFVHLYLSSISHFAKINKYYQEFFGSILPPSRSCVAVGENVLREGRRVMMDCIVQRGSGAYMRIQPEADLDKIESSLPKNNALFIKQEKMNPHHQLRSTLHVQTISHWAPVCVGPYSQANTLRSGLIFLAGQIGLVPSSMILIEGGWKSQLMQSWKNAAAVLDALHGSLEEILGAVIYINSADVASNPSTIWQEVDQICSEQVRTNGEITAGQVDDRLSPEDDYGGYEDYETWKEIESSQLSDKIESTGDVKNFLAVALPQMPKGALSEVELVCATRKASTCLKMTSTSSWLTDKSNCEVKSCNNGNRNRINWDICNDEGTNLNPIANTVKCQSPIKIESVLSSLGQACAAIVNTVAFFPFSEMEDQIIPIQPLSLMQDMVNSSLRMMTTHSAINIDQIMHVRLFHTTESRDSGLDDQTLRIALNTVLSMECSRMPQSNSHQQRPAFSVVPVDAIYISPVPPGLCVKESKPILGMHVIAADLIHLETEMWIHHNRAYNT